MLMHFRSTQELGLMEEDRTRGRLAGLLMELAKHNEIFNSWGSNKEL